MPTIETLSERPKPVAPTTLGCEVLARFECEPDTLVIPVVDGDRPVGLVERTAFLQKIAARFGHALYDLRPITFAMDPEPAVVEAGVGVAVLALHERELGGGDREDEQGGGGEHVGARCWRERARSCKACGENTPKPPERYGSYQTLSRLLRQRRGRPRSQCSPSQPSRQSRSASARGEAAPPTTPRSTPPAVARAWILVTMAVAVAP